MRICFLFFKQKTAYEMRISDWSSDVCSSDLLGSLGLGGKPGLFGSLGLFGGLSLGSKPGLFGSLGVGGGLSLRSKPGLFGSLGLGSGLSPVGRASCRERVCQYV